LESKAFSTGPATAASAAEAKAFGLVSPARYSAVTAANAARKYVLAIAISFAFIVFSLRFKDWLAEPNNCHGLRLSQL
jgi:hypothetical protein